MEKLTDAEVVKAMGVCNSVSERCYDCPYYDMPPNVRAGKTCSEIMMENAIDLINRKDAEIERLEKARQKQAIFLGEERGQKYEQINIITDLKKQLAQAKSEAYREFGHLLIDKSENGVIHTMDIPDYVKELTEVPDINDGKRGDRCYE